MMMDSNEVSMVEVDRLLHQHWPTAAEVATHLKLPAGQDLGRLRDQGQLLGCWDRHLGQFRYPRFQFTDEGQVRPEAVALLAAMLADPDWALEADPHGWRKVLWLHEDHPELAAFRSTAASQTVGPQIPAQVLEEDPWAVLALVQARLAELEVA